MNIADQHKKAAEFIERWQGRGDEKQETQKFWFFNGRNTKSQSATKRWNALHYCEEYS